MKRLQWLTMLMGVTLLVITGFQGYWLKNNYDREKRSMQIKANMGFQEVVRRLQGLKFKMNLPGFPADSARPTKMRVMVSDIPGGMGVYQENGFRKRTVPEQIITWSNALRDRIRDSVSANSKGKNGVMISIDSTFISSDSSHARFNKHLELRNDRIFQVVYGLDSLQDTIHLADIQKDYTNLMRQQEMNIPFNVVIADSFKVVQEDEVPDMSEITIGILHPKTYKLVLGNTFPYLIKKISLPILFSFFLVGVTILSFVLLYRSLLKQQRLAEIKNEFISNITHELKTPIATVGVAIEALKNFNAMDDPRRTKEYLDISSNELQRLSLLVDKVLKLSMFEKKEIELKYEPLNLLDLVNEVVASLRLQIEKNNAHVSVYADGDVNLQADKLHLLSIVFNLLDNSLKYSKGNPAIQVEVKGEAETVQLSVKDNGIGIAPEYKDKIFEKFFRVPTGDTHNAKGYGLGLSYVAHVVRRHNGNITVDSQPEWGTKITITLPRNHA